MDVPLEQAFIGQWKGTELVNGQTQVILTTHSPYLVDLFTPDEVSVCRRQDGETKVARLSQSKAVQEQLDIFSLGEIWTAEGDEKLAVPVAGENAA